MLRQILVGALCTLALVACGKTIDGLLTNTEALTFNVKDKAFSLPVGQWETAIKFASKTEVRLDITVPGQKNTVVAFKVLKSNPLPQENGTFELLAQDSGQPYDVSGSVATTHVDSQEQWQQEGCTYQTYRTECHYQPNGAPVCYSIPYTVQGWRDVRFFNRDSTQTVDFNLLTATKSTPGAFKAVDQSSRRVYTMQGQCR